MRKRKPCSIIGWQGTTGGKRVLALHQQPVPGDDGRVPRALADQARPDDARHRGDRTVITSDLELQATQERIAYMQRVLAQLRVTSRPEVFPSMASGYRSEIERMQREVLDFLTRHASEFVTA